MPVHPISALAGYDASELSQASETASRTAATAARAGAGLGLGLPDMTDTQLYPSPAQRRPLDHTNGRSPATPRPGKPRMLEPPSTGRKRDPRRGYGVVVGSGAEDASSALYTTRDESVANSNTLTMDDDQDLQKLQRQMQLQLQPDGSLADSGEDQTDVTPDVPGLDARALRRKAAAGASLKQYEERIQSLTERVNDLQVEVDFYRRTKPPSELETEIIALRKQNKTLIDKEQLHRKMLKEQDKALKGRPLELEEPILKLQAERDALKSQLRRAQQEQQEQQHRADANVEAALRNLRDEHASEMYRLEIERDELVDKLAEQSAQLDMSRNGSMRQRSEQVALLTAERDEAQQELETARLERVELEEELLAHQRQEGQLQDELQDAQRRLEEYDEEHAQLAQERQELASAYEDQIKLVQDQVTSLQLDGEKKDRRVQELTHQCEELEGNVAELDYELGRKVQEMEQLEERLVETEREADDLEKRANDLQDQLAQRDADLDAAGRETDEMTDQIAALHRVVRQLEADLRTKTEQVASLTAALENAELKLQTAERRDQALRDRLNDVQARCAELEQQTAEIDALRLDAEAQADAHRAQAMEEAEAHKRTKAELEIATADLAASIEQRRAEKRAASQQMEEYEAELRDREAEYRAALAERENERKKLEDEWEIRRAEAEELKEAMQRMQDELQDQADQSVRNDHSYATAKYTLELEADRLRRKVATLERELEAANKATDRQADLVKERDLDGTKAKAEIRDLAGKLSAEQQARLGLADRFEMQARALQKAQEELEETRGKLDDLESARADETRNKLQASEQTMRQLKERNTLLMSVYQQLGRLAGPDKLSLRKKEEETKPFTNFSIFHDSLLARLKRVGDLRAHFEQRTKEIEAELTERYSTLRRQQDAQTRRMNQLETSVKTAGDKQALWRNRVAAKQTELDAVRSAHSELQSQIASMKSASRMAVGRSASPNVSASRITPAAERKLAVAQNQLAAAEERMEEARARHELDEAKWKERVRELESQIKRAPRPSAGAAAASRPSSGAASKDKDKDKDKDKETGAWADYKKEIKNQIRRTKEEMDRTKKHSRKLDDLLDTPGPDGEPAPAAESASNLKPKAESEPKSDPEPKPTS